MSIANIVLAALGILGMLIAWAGLGVGGAAISGSGYDYFYTEDGLYFTTDDVSALLGMLGFLVFLVIVCAVLILVAGILGVLRRGPSPRSCCGIMIWNIVAAVVSLLSCCWVSLVLCIIVAVFANKDRALYAAPAPAAPYGYAPAAAPVAPVAPQQPRAARSRCAPAACRPGRRCSRGRCRGRRGRCRRSDARHGRYGPLRQKSSPPNRSSRPSQQQTNP